MSVTAKWLLDRIHDEQNRLAEAAEAIEVYQEAIQRLHTSEANNDAIARLGARVEALELLANKEESQ